MLLQGAPGALSKLLLFLPDLVLLKVLLCPIRDTEEACPANQMHLKDLLSKQEDPSEALFLAEDPDLNLHSLEEPEKLPLNLKDVAKNLPQHLSHPLQ